MTKADLRSYRQQLLALKQRYGGMLTELEASALHPSGADAEGGLSHAPIHPSDVSSDEYEEEVALGLLENESQLLIEVNEALQRIEGGKFGVCDACGRDISKQRLQALPYVHYCLSCARRILGGAQT